MEGGRYCKGFNTYMRWCLYLNEASRSYSRHDEIIAQVKRNVLHKLEIINSPHSCQGPVLVRISNILVHVDIIL